MARIHDNSMERLPIAVGEMFDRLAAVEPAWTATEVGAAAFGLTLLGMAACVPRWRRPLGHLALFAAILLGGLSAKSRASALDDAFVSLRYARHFAEGHGLVFNLGERVEGFTNLAWTLLLAAVVRGVGDAAPAWMVGLSGLSFLLDILLVWWIAGRRSAVGGPSVVVLLFAVQRSVVDFATGGLETSFASAGVLAGLLAWVQAERTGQVRWLGAAAAAFALSALTRPDHAIFAVSFAFWAGAAAIWRAGVRGAGRPLLAVVLPLSSLGIASLWRWVYYGDWVPNTYWAKSADLAYWGQGAIYVVGFVLGSRAWLWVPGLIYAGLSAWRRRDVVAAGMITMLVLFPVYVARVGGDFMFGRFFVVLVPLALLLLDEGMHLRDLRGRVLLLLGLLSVGGVPLVGPEHRRWNLADESAYYPVTQWSPDLVVEHQNFEAGHRMRRYLTDRGIRPVIATSGIGMVGYYSDLPLIDLRGLTDRTVAHTSLLSRGLPGHEKWPQPEYLVARGVRIIRWEEANPETWRGVTRLKWGAGSPKDWHIFVYDAALMEEIAQKSPEIRFRRFPDVFDAWAKDAEVSPPPSLAEDAAFIRRYYLDANTDPRRADRLRAILAAAGVGAPAAPASR